MYQGKHTVGGLYKLGRTGILEIRLAQQIEQFTR